MSDDPSERERPSGPRARYLGAVLFLACVAAVGSVRSEAVFGSRHDRYTYVAEDGRTYPYLHHADSYSWVRKAKYVLERGSPCESIQEGRCWDGLRLAPVGSVMPYFDSLHVDAIVLLHRAVRWLRPSQPLEVSAALLQVVVGTLTVIPSWLLCMRLGGVWAAFAGSLSVGLSEAVVVRTLGADTDIWSVAMMLTAVWCALESVSPGRLLRRVAYAMAAAVVLGIFGRIWSGWTLTVASVALLLLGSTLWVAARGWRLRVWRETREELVALLLVGVVMVGVVCAVVGTKQAWRDLVVPLGKSAQRAGGWADAVPERSSHEPFQRVPFPYGFKHVGELRRPSFSQHVEVLGGWWVVLGGWLGVLAVALPLRRWGATERALFMVALALAAGVPLGTASSMRDAWLMVMLPVAIAIALRLIDRRSAQLNAPGPLLLLPWLTATLMLSEVALRFAHLAALPLGVAFGVGGARVIDQVRRRTHDRKLEWLLAGVLVSCALHGARGGVVHARTALPHLNDVWYEALRHLKHVAPPDAIVHAFWHRGYLVQSVAERAVTSDGASHTRRVTHWFSRALLARDARTSLGLVRMLSCGLGVDDADGRGFGTATRIFDNGFRAYAIVLELAAMTRAEAERHLASLDVPAVDRADLLALTHCAPRPSYLVLDDQLLTTPELIYQGSWDPGRAFVAQRARTWPEPRMLAFMVRALGMSDLQARKTYEQARRLEGGSAQQAFIQQDADLDGSVVSRLLLDPGYSPPGFERVDERVDALERVITVRLHFPTE